MPDYYANDDLVAPAPGTGPVAVTPVPTNTPSESASGPSRIQPNGTPQEGPSTNDGNASADSGAPLVGNVRPADGNQPASR